MKLLLRGASEYTPPPPPPEMGRGGGGGIYNFSLDIRLQPCLGVTTANVPESA